MVLCPIVMRNPSTSQSLTLVIQALVLLDVFDILRRLSGVGARSNERKNAHNQIFKGITNILNL